MKLMMKKKKLFFVCCKNEFYINMTIKTNLPADDDGNYKRQEKSENKEGK
jgi:hypothetical protein